MTKAMGREAVEEVKRNAIFILKPITTGKGIDDMARATTKEELLSTAQEQFEKLLNFIDTMPAQEQQGAFLFEDRDKNLRDVLTHLHQWHNMMKNWHRIGTIEKGLPQVPGESYTWRTLPELNHKIWVQCQSIPLEDSKGLLQQSHQKMMELIEGHTNEELFEKKVYPWTKTTTLGAYFVSSTASHYDWALKKLKKHHRTYSKAR